MAFAKLQGEGFEYLIPKYEISLGRKSKSTELDIVLGKQLQLSARCCHRALTCVRGQPEHTVLVWLQETI